MQSECPKYGRGNQYGSWIDVDDDCQNTRAEILIKESKAPVTFTSSSNCTVESGSWYDPYTGNTYILASDVDIDHFVPLAEAHRSGAWAWSNEKRIEYANFREDPNHLIPVDDETNQNKSDKDPGEWMPPNEAYWIEYAKIWASIKVKWGLKADKRELEALRGYLAGESGVVYPEEADEVYCSGE